MKHKLEDDYHCFVCGEKNLSGLHLQFTLCDGKLRTEFLPQKIFQGYKDIVHGGIIATVLDETMVKAAIVQGIPAVTAELTVRFKKPLAVGEKVIVEAEVTSTNRKLIEAKATARRADGTPIAEGHATLLRQD